MAARKPPASEAETEEPTEKVETDRESIVAIVKEVLGEMLPGGDPDTPAADPEPAADKPVTAREEEARTHNIVAEAIKVFLDEVKGETKEPEKKEPETEPGKKEGRKVSTWLWGVE